MHLWVSLDYETSGGLLEPFGDVFLVGLMSLLTSQYFNLAQPLFLLSLSANRTSSRSRRGLIFPSIKLLGLKISPNRTYLTSFFILFGFLYLNGAYLVLICLMSQGNFTVSRQRTDFSIVPHFCAFNCLTFDVTGGF